jgi:hypothetical protein
MVDSFKSTEELESMARVAEQAGVSFRAMGDAANQINTPLGQAFAHLQNISNLTQGLVGQTQELSAEQYAESVAEAVTNTNNLADATRSFTASGSDIEKINAALTKMNENSSELRGYLREAATEMGLLAREMEGQKNEKIHVGLDENEVSELRSILEEVAGLTKKEGSMFDENEIKTVNTGVDLLSRAKARISKMPLVPKEQRQLVNQLHQGLVKVGASGIKINYETEKHKKMLAGELVSRDKLTRSDKRRIQDLRESGKLNQRYTEINGKMVQLEGNKGDLSTQASKMMKEQLGGLKDFMKQSLGVNISLAGIVGMLIQALDKGRQLNAMGTQAAAQWGTLNDRSTVAEGLITNLRQQFKLSLTEAGNLVTAMTRAGIPMQAMLGDVSQNQNITQKLVATEKVYGQTVAAQLGDMTSLVNMSSQLERSSASTLDPAQLYLDTIRQTAEDIPMLSMDDAINDVKELANLTKGYNTELLGTLALYNAMSRQDAAKRLGLGNVGRDVRKNIAKELVGMANKLDLGWKIILGQEYLRKENRGEEAKSAGKSARVYEQLLAKNPLKAFDTMAGFLVKSVKGMGGNMDDKMRLFVQEQLQGFGFGPDEARALTEVIEKIVKGGGTTTEFGKMVMGFQAKAKADESSARKKQDAVIRTGVDIATGMTDLIELLKIWVEGYILPFIADVSAALSKWFGDNYKVTSKPGEYEGDIGKKLVDALQGNLPGTTAVEGLTAAEEKGGKTGFLLRDDVRQDEVESKVSARMSKGQKGADYNTALARARLISKDFLRKLNAEDLFQSEEFQAAAGKNAGLAKTFNVMAPHLQNEAARTLAYGRLGTEEMDEYINLVANQRFDEAIALLKRQFKELKMKKTVAPPPLVGANAPKYTPKTLVRQETAVGDLLPPTATR